MTGKKKTVKSLPKKTTKKSTKSTTKKKKQSKKKVEFTNKTVLFCGILVVLAIILIGITFSYAFWTHTETQTNQNIVNAGCLSFSLKDIDIEGNITSINLQNSYPMSDERGIRLEPYSFTITNTCTIEADFFVYLHKLSSSTLNSKYVKYNLVNSEKNISYGPALVNTIAAGSLANDINNIVKETLGEIDETYQISNVSLLPNESTTFNLRMWIDYDAPNSIMGLSYDSAVSVFATTPQ